MAKGAVGGAPRGRAEPLGLLPLDPEAYRARAPQARRLRRASGKTSADIEAKLAGSVTRARQNKRVGEGRRHPPRRASSPKGSRFLDGSEGTTYRIGPRCRFTGAGGDGARTFATGRSRTLRSDVAFDRLAETLSTPADVVVRTLAREATTLAPPAGCTSVRRPSFGPYRCVDKLGVKAGWGVRLAPAPSTKRPARVVALKTVQVSHESMLSRPPSRDLRAEERRASGASFGSWTTA